MQKLTKRSSAGGNASGFRVRVQPLQTLSEGPIRWTVVRGAKRRLTYIDGTHVTEEPIGESNEPSGR